MRYVIMLIVFGALVTSIFATELQVGIGQEYATIKLAMLAAVNGDIITVHDGSYISGVKVNKEVVLRCGKAGYLPRRSACLLFFNPC
ncbi:MAG: hypothetical protein PHY48_07950 [Candidatus Cloacimonetes bacterium]|nr:hypothetical protein [Candidatus Cloacimonadota bacterium]